MKTCNRCKVEKPLDAFNKRSINPDGLASTCRECINKSGYKKKPAGSQRTCTWCEKPIEKGQKAKRLARTKTQITYRHMECWEAYLAVLESMSGPVAKPETCASGHIKTEENTKVYVYRGKTSRHCLDCRAEKKRREKARTLASVHW